MSKLSKQDKMNLIDDLDTHIVHTLNKGGGLNITGNGGWSLKECKLIVNKYTDKELKMAISIKHEYIQQYRTALKEEKATRDFEIAFGLRKKSRK